MNFFVLSLKLHIAIFTLYDSFRTFGKMFFAFIDRIKLDPTLIWAISFFLQTTLNVLNIINQQLIFFTLRTPRFYTLYIQIFPYIICKLRQFFKLGILLIASWAINLIRIGINPFLKTLLAINSSLTFITCDWIMCKL